MINIYILFLKFWLIFKFYFIIYSVCIKKIMWIMKKILRIIKFLYLKFGFLRKKLIISYWLGMGVCLGGRGGCVGGRICLFLCDSKVILFLRVLIFWVCNCISWIKCCCFWMLVLWFLVNFVLSDFCCEFSICLSFFFFCNKIVKVFNFCVFFWVSCVILFL